MSNGTYVYQPDFDPATKELMEECAHILHDIPKDIVDTNITCPQWQYQWGKANGRTSSTWVDKNIMLGGLQPKKCFIYFQKIKSQRLVLSTYI